MCSCKRHLHVVGDCRRHHLLADSCTCGRNRHCAKVWAYVALILIGFCIYGPVALVTIQAVNLVPKNATGTAAGFVGIFGYLVGDSLLSKIIVGSVADYSWNAANLTMVIGAALGVVLCILTIKSEKA